MTKLQLDVPELEQRRDFDQSAWLDWQLAWVVISRHALRSNDDEGSARIHYNIPSSILSDDFETRF